MTSKDASGTGTADPAGPRSVERATPSDTFGALGNEVRTAVLRTLADEQPCSFSTLAAGSDAGTSAGFAYHLRQLDGQFLRQREDERYELTARGREAVQAMASGAVTVSVDHDPVDLEEQCPHCREQCLHLRVNDNVADVACDACGRPVLELQLPPGGSLGRNPETLPDALDAYHRHRVRSFADGVCPDCGGTAVAAAGDTRDGRDQPPGETAEDWPPGDVQLSFDCEACGAGLDCPPTVGVLDHPDVVSFYHEHGADLGDRPLWNVGPEWRERLVSTDPWCVLVSTRLDDEVLELYLSGDGRVVGSQRRPVDEGSATEEADAAGTETTSRDDAAA